MDLKKFVGQLGDVGCVMSEQRSEIAPVDEIITKCGSSPRRSRALPLITASVLSRKLAQGAEGLVVDVKWGNGSFIKDLEQAKTARPLHHPCGRSMKRRCVALGHGYEPNPSATQSAPPLRSRKRSRS